MAEKKQNFSELDEFMEKLEAAGEDEAAIEKVFNEGKKAVASELSEQELSNVSGGRYGITLNGMINFIFGEGAANLTWHSVAVVARCLYDYAKYGDAYRTYSQSYVNSLNEDFERRMPEWLKKIS